MTAVPTHVYRKRYWTLAVLCGALTLVGIDLTVLNVAIEDLVRELGANESDIQWIIAVYSLTFAGFVVVMGAISDRFGRRRILVIGLVAFGVVSGVGAWSQTAGQLIAVRAITGIAAAMVMPGTLSILASVFPPDERQHAIGIWSGIGGLGFVLGPPVGGILLTYYWWGSVLLINVGVAAILVVLTFVVVPESRDPLARKLDLPGAALSIVGLTALVAAFIEAPSNGWLNPVILAAFAIAAVSLAGFVLWELRAKIPMLDVRLFTRPTFSVPSLVITFGTFVAYGISVIAAQYLQFVEDLSILIVGFVLAPISVAWCASALCATRLVNRFGTKLVLTAGLCLVIAGSAEFVIASSGNGTWVTIVGMTLVGLGMGIAVTPATNVLIGALPLEKAGVGASMNDVTREAGGAIGIAVMGSVLAAVFLSRISSPLDSLPGDEAGQASGGVGPASQVAAQIGGAAGSEFKAAVDLAFLGGLRASAIVGAAVILGVLGVTLFWFPKTKLIQNVDKA